jgi:hypothetical protein
LGPIGLTKIDPNRGLLGEFGTRHLEICSNGFTLDPNLTRRKKMRKNREKSKKKSTMSQ